MAKPLAARARRAVAADRARVVWDRVGEVAEADRGARPPLHRANGWRARCVTIRGEGTAGLHGLARDFGRPHRREIHRRPCRAEEGRRLAREWRGVDGRHAAEADRAADRRRAMAAGATGASVRCSLLLAFLALRWGGAAPGEPTLVSRATEPMDACSRRRAIRPSS